MDTFPLLIHSARQIVQVVAKGERVLRGRDMSTIAVLEGSDTEYLSLLVNRKGLIEDFGTDTEVQSRHPDLKVDRRIDAAGKCIIPGLVDAHTHPVWAGDRVHEFAMKLAGATYMEVHKAGGGIHFTVDHTRRASEEELYCSFKKRLGTMIKTGTTLVECKSGYGLDMDTEIKMLKVIERARRDFHIDISSTYCGAHAVPKGKTSAEATEDVINVQLPKIKKMMNDGELMVDNIDVFCEQGVFDTEQSRRILQAGKDMGLLINFHGDELHPTHSAEMGAELSATAISHLEEISDDGIAAMVESGSVGVVLPTTAYILRLNPPPVRKMIDSGMAVALGSDFNPNAYCMCMPLVMHLACVLLKMSMPEVLAAATINSAAALGKADMHGSIEVGKYANLMVINANRWEHLIYQMGCHDEVIHYVIYHGSVVHERSS
ncbi:hypothetical protein CHS0354_029630 [Potamilus streckersoni]|uniref:Probable imidazolonepropionase n=1 Tax=Potamilus streckersoni TaxID=2493646 RepID=A0AAE0RTD1_9BIVA|nr:hypothetical protein CHS0354_029630 [Potamilus streckersoni]